MLDTQVQAPQAGAGIRPKTYEADPATAEEMRKHVPHYVFSPGEKLGLGDRQLSIPEVLQGRLALVEDHPYLERNRSSEYIKGEDKNDTILYTKSAQDSAREIVTSFIVGEVQKAYIIQSLTGVDANTAITIENVLVPVLPPTLRKLVTYLMSDARRNIEASELVGSERTLADKVRSEMYDAARRVLNLQMNYLDRTERELINSRKPNGKGKSSLDDLDKHYYRMCERKMPLEADLDFVATQEMKASGDEVAQSGPLADAIAKLAEAVSTKPAPVVEDDRVAKLEAELADTQAKFNQLLDLVEAGTVKKKTVK